jgi:DNA-directed RNA polymerase specialized sigma24 family protein
MEKSDGFETTQWGLVAAAAAPTDAKSQWALSQLCEQYWFPIYAYIRRQGYSADKAEDLTQTFFAIILERKTFRRVDRERGRLRTYLLGAVTRFLAGQHQRAAALKRGGGKRAVPLDLVLAEGRFRIAESDSQSPEKLFDRQWALTVLDLAMNALKREYAIRGKEERFDQLHGQLTGDEKSIKYRELAAAMKTTEGALKVRIHRMRQEYRRIVRELIGQTLTSPGEVEEEVQHLFAALAR